MAFTILLASICCAFVYAVVNSILVYRRLTHIPGPRLAPFTRFTHLRISAGGAQAHTCLQLSRQYGPLCRIGPKHVLTSSTEMIRRMNSPRSKYRRSAWYNALRFKPRVDNMFSARSETHHNELRRIMKPGYDGKENEQLEMEIEAAIAGLVDLIEREYVYGKDKGKPMDLAMKAAYWSMDTMGRIAFGKELGSCQSDTDSFGFIRAVQESLPVMVALGTFPDVHAWLEKSRIVDLVAPSGKDSLGLGKVVGIIQEKVAERYGPAAKDVKDMLGSFVRHGLSQEEANAEAVLLTVAGSDTTATALRVTLLHLFCNPPALARLHLEIDTGISSGAISSPAKEIETRNLLYLQACIKEGLRIWPPATGLVEKEVPAEGDYLDGTFLPGGTLISTSFFGATRDPAVFGEDADYYRPERWLEVEGDDLRTMTASSDLVFGHGRFECVGKRVALIELQKVIVELLRRYNFAILRPDKPFESKNYGAFAQKNMWVRVTKR